MNFLIDQVRNQKFLEAEVNIDNFIQDNNISDQAIIYKMEFMKEVFAEESEVREYLKDKYFHNFSIADESDKFIVELISDSQIDDETMRVIELRRGVMVHAGDLIPMPIYNELCFSEKGKTINLHEGLPNIIEICKVAEGDHPAYGKLKITQETLETFVNNFKTKVTGVDLAVNEDHKKNEAFGWFRDVFLSYDKQTLYGQVVWNSKGIQALSEKEYRYFSPEFRFNYVHPHTGVDHGATLMGGALTNYPFLKMGAITELNNKKDGVEIMSKETTIDLSAHNAKVVELSSKIQEVQLKFDSQVKINVELSEKVKELEAAIEKKEREAANEKLFKDGKINAAQLVALNEGKGILEVLSLSEKMNTQPAGKSGAGNVISLSEKEMKICESLGLTPEEYQAANK